MERWQICIVPSARLAGQNEKLKEPLKALVIGHQGDNTNNFIKPDFKQNALILNADELFQDKATPQKVLQTLPNANLIHFICHGQDDRISPLASSLQLEPDENHQDGRFCGWLYRGRNYRQPQLMLSHI